RSSTASPTASRARTCASRRLRSATGRVTGRLRVKEEELQRPRGLLSAPKTGGRAPGVDERGSIRGSRRAQRLRLGHEDDPALGRKPIVQVGEAVLERVPAAAEV